MTDIRITLDNILQDLQRLMSAYTVRGSEPVVSLLKQARQAEQNTHTTNAPPSHFSMTPKVALMTTDEQIERLYDVVKAANKDLTFTQADVDTLSGTLTVSLHLVHPNWRWAQQDCLTCTADKPLPIHEGTLLHQPIISQSMIARHRNTAFSAFDKIRQLELMLEHEHRYVNYSGIEAFRADVGQTIAEHEHAIQRVWLHLVTLRDRMDASIELDGHPQEKKAIWSELNQWRDIVSPFEIEVIPIKGNTDEWIHN